MRGEASKKFKNRRHCFTNTSRHFFLLRVINMAKGNKKKAKKRAQKAVGNAAHDDTTTTDDDWWCHWHDDDSSQAFE